MASDLHKGLRIAAIITGIKGIVFTAIGWLFQIMEWPDSNFLQWLGYILLGVAVLLILISGAARGKKL